jgi:hypothetical protein
MNNSKKNQKHPKTNRSYLTDGATMADSNLENNSLIEQSPAIAIVAPTARNPINHAVNSNSSVTPCKAHSTSRTFHHIHHIQPVQIATSSTSINLTQPQNTPMWTGLEPAFYFGPGFEIHQSYCPTHSRQHTDQHIVMFYLSADVAASFQITGGYKILQGMSNFDDSRGFQRSRIQISYFCSGFL